MENPSSDPNYSKEVHAQIGQYLSSLPIEHVVCIGKWAKEIQIGALASGMDPLKVSYYQSIDEAKKEK